MNSTINKTFYTWLYVIILSRTSFRVNPHSIVCMNVKELLPRVLNPEPLSSLTNTQPFSQFKWPKENFYTCSTESMFLRYKKSSKNAVKVCSFLQCSVHIFLGHDGGFCKINLRILWNRIMKNFHVKHGQCNSIIFP